MYTSFSIYKAPVSNTRPAENTNLKEVYGYIVSPKAKYRTERLRALRGQEAREYKTSAFDHCTFGGVFKERKLTGLLVSSNLLCLDLDHVDVSSVKETLRNDKNICLRLLFTSPSGDGVKAVVEIAKSKEIPYSTWFDALKVYLSQEYSLEVDGATRDISRTCFLPYDPDCYINEQPCEITFNPLDYVRPEIPQVRLERVPAHIQSQRDDIAKLVETVEEKQIDITADRMDWIKIAFALVSIYGDTDEGLSMFTRFSQFYPSFKPSECRAKWRDAVRNTNGTVSIASVMEIAARYGVRIKEVGDDFSDLSLSDDVLAPKKTKRKKVAIDGIVRIADVYYQEIEGLDGDVDLIVRKKDELKEDNLDFDTVPKYIGFTVEHSFYNHRRIINGRYNMSSKTTWLPKKGEWPTIKKLFSHIFGEQVEIAYDYYQLMITKPEQILPVVALVSKEQQTGKTTLLNFNTMLFQHNAININMSIYTQPFNGIYADKLVVGIDETSIRETFIKERLKNDATSKTIQLRKMYSDHVTLPFYAKFFLTSNNETNFVSMDEEDMRFWVRKIPRLKIYDPHFEKKLYNEIPAFLDFLSRRALFVPVALSRQWFSREQLWTEALEAAVNAGQEDLKNDIVEACLDLMASDGTDVLYLDNNTLFEMLHRKYTPSVIGRCFKQTFGISNKIKKIKEVDNTWHSRRVYVVKREMLEANKALL